MLWHFTGKLYVRKIVDLNLKHSCPKLWPVWNITPHAQNYSKIINEKWNEKEIFSI